MAGYTKNIAVLKPIRQGFSADGGALSGLIRVEKYGSSLRVEATFLNFAPLSEGRLVTGLYDGVTMEFMEGTALVKESELDTSKGFAALVCFVHKTVLPIARAVCGNFAFAQADIERALKEREKCQEVISKKVAKGGNGTAKTNAAKVGFSKASASKGKISVDSASADGENTDGAKTDGASAADGTAAQAVYEDEAIAEDNYYEYDKVIKDDNVVWKDSQKAGADGPNGDQDAARVGLKQNAEKAAQAFMSAQSFLQKKAQTTGKKESDFVYDENAVPLPNAEGKPYFNGMKKLVEGIFESYPPLVELNERIAHSRWVKIAYGENRFYAFGVLFEKEEPAYFAYAVQGVQKKMPPSLKGYAFFVPLIQSALEQTGYWVMYQDAGTGASIPQEDGEFYTK